MDGITVFFIIFFGIAAIIPATWSIIGLVRGNTNFWPAVVGTGWAVVLLLVTIIGIATNWGGCPPKGASSEGAVECFKSDRDEHPCEPDVWKIECKGRPMCAGTALTPGAFCPPGQITVFPFCERIQFGGQKQPWAIWSDLSFIAAGLWLLWFFQYFGPSTGPDDNPMRQIGSLSVTYCLIVIFMGPPSQWFHASLKDLGGWFDAMSVVIWLMFNAVYVWYAVCFAMTDKMSGRPRGIARTFTVLGVWAGLVTICGIIAMWPDARLYLYFASGVPWGLGEVAALLLVKFHPDVTYKRNGLWFGANFLVLVVTMSVWCLYNPDVTLFTSATACHRREWFPGHALFHILASFSTILTFISFKSERRWSRLTG